MRTFGRMRTREKPPGAARKASVRRHVQRHFQAAKISGHRIDHVMPDSMSRPNDTLQPHVLSSVLSKSLTPLEVKGVSTCNSIYERTESWEEPLSSIETLAVGFPRESRTSSARTDLMDTLIMSLLRFGMTQMCFRKRTREACKTEQGGKQACPQNSPGIIGHPV